MRLQELTSSYATQARTAIAAFLPRVWPRNLRVAIPSSIVLLGIWLVIGVGQVSESEWSEYPLVVMTVRPVDPTELLRGAYVDLYVDDPERSGRGTVVRFLAPEDEAREIEAALRTGPVKAEFRRAPDGRLRAVVVITANGRRFETR